MKKGRKWLIYSSIALLLVIVLGFYPGSKDLDPSEWVKVTIRDTVNVPIKKLWELVGNVKLEKAAGNRKYNDLPSIERTRALVGDFSKAGHSRIVYFSTGDTLVETIIDIKEAHIFSYEITKPSLPMKWAVYRARGTFLYSAIDSNRTETKWTYAFHNKNFISRFFIDNYINSTHRSWMRDMLNATKKNVEEAYGEEMKPSRTSAARGN